MEFLWKTILNNNNNNKGKEIFANKLKNSKMGF